MLGTTWQGDDVVINAVSTDSRTLEGAALFIALKGPNYDANKFLAEVVEKGAVALICSEEPSVAVPYILVPDGRLALGQFSPALKQK